MRKSAALPGLEIREGLVAELDTFADFWLAMFEEIGILSERDLGTGWRLRFAGYMRDRIQRREAAFFVATEGGTIVGTAGALLADGYFALTGMKRGYIFGVRVDDAHRGLGIATTLTKASVEFLQSLGCKKIRLHASPFGRRIYERLGFTPTNEMELRKES